MAIYISVWGGRRVYFHECGGGSVAIGYLLS